MVRFAKTWSSRISPLEGWRTGLARVSRATLAVLLLLLPATTLAATNLVVSFTTTNPTPLNTGFAGFCTAMQTNAIYNVQAASNLPGGWTTLGRVANTVTNFGFTNWSAGQQQFYRLVVP